MKDVKKIQAPETKDRRTLLKGIVAGSAVVTGSKALPETWTKPISGTVILPSHAQTTNGDYSGGDYYEYVPGEGRVPGDGPLGDEDEREVEDFDYGTDDYGEDNDHNTDDYEFTPTPGPPD